MTSDFSEIDAPVSVEIRATPLDTESMVSWVTTADSGAVVLFLGVVRDHAEGRDDVEALSYEAYEEPARRALGDVAAAAHARWPGINRTALAHRVGRLELSESAVAVAVSSAHRADAFEAARFCIDTIKQSVPIWKKEHWATGAGWGTGSQPIRAVEVPAESGS